ncbi:phospholipase D-like domain-containing protein [Paenibacillus sp. W2I17]|uniref:phospholipase D-like domain-containing protein n=1 Tax=Paenibacillus sp. W2I17 TaxID=3042311 RepID=UPI0027898E5B|nr:phospholipase D-like domain-containing protein [Paenibacillus sp. W2I17]MDQ0656998.1 phosphatidylserine/phosphatidylglycerophosphate/cardiolipin synthase-like enzyme [Paenibacillus sp. W2I17]
MQKEILFSQGKVIFFKESDFWTELLNSRLTNTKNIYIATYNFNFENKYERSFYRKLADIANSGVDINLLYAKRTFSSEDKLEIEDIFKNFVLCAELITNHSKLFITDNFAYIGSANFSFGSNNNYESGVIFEDENIVSEIKSFYCRELLDKSEFTNVPECFDPFDYLTSILEAVEYMITVEKKDDLYLGNIPQLRFLDGLEKDLEKIGYPVPRKFDWWSLYLQIYEQKVVPDDTTFNDFQLYLNEIFVYLNEVISFINEQYKSIGRVEMMKKINNI